MPCEACNVQFTVFRRKRCCFDCKRFYCSSCLNTPSLRSAVGPLCERCSIFAKRPLLKVDLLQLKPKDLIFYLQSKHISTAGCVEKDELVGLVLNHIQQTDQLNPESASQDTRTFDTAHSFDTLKQSCQNFFSNISEKVDVFSFETKPTQNKSQAQQNRRSSTNQQSAHISEQPRVSTREIPTYASFKNRLADDDVAHINLATPSDSNAAQSNNIDYSLDSSPPRTHSQTSSLESKSSSTSSASSSQQPATADYPSVEQHCLRTTPDRPKVHGGYDVTVNGFASGCDCSDDEIITTFRARTGERLQSPQSTSSIENPMAGPSGSCNVLTSTSTATKKSSPSLKIESYDESSESSFEELGAIGGISDDSKVGADNNGQTSEPWQFVEKDALGPSDNNKDKKQAEVMDNGAAPLTVVVMHQDANMQVQRPVVLATRPKKVTRRRSESYLNRNRHRSVDESPTSPEGNKSLAPPNSVEARCLREEDEPSSEMAAADDAREEVEVAGTHFHCKRCGKHRINIKNHVEKMRRHLENSQMTESDIKQELEEFLLYLEKRTKSFDCSDSEMTAASSVSGIRVDANCQNPAALDSMSPLQFYDDNEGIHVYAPPAGYAAEMTDSRFINLEDFESLEELERLCVKQLKEVLMLNRVDYKGCCEKQELLDRVVRLWKNLKSTPTIDKLQTDELCKICMDAPIECVILECGHMATCTSCGKVLSECPICRQYIVRVVRFFKA